MGMGLKHVIVVEDSPDGLSVVGEAFSEHRSVQGIKVQDSNIVKVLQLLADKIIERERHARVLDEIDASE